MHRFYCIIIIIIMIIMIIILLLFLIQLNFITIVGPWRLHQWLKEHFKSIGRNLPMR